MKKKKKQPKFVCKNFIINNIANVVAKRYDNNQNSCKFSNESAYTF